MLLWKTPPSKSLSVSPWQLVWGLEYIYLTNDTAAWLAEAGFLLQCCFCVKNLLKIRAMILFTSFDKRYSFRRRRKSSTKRWIQISSSQIRSYPTICWSGQCASQTRSFSRSAIPASAPQMGRRIRAHRMSAWRGIWRKKWRCLWRVRYVASLHFFKPELGIFRDRK